MIQVTRVQASLLSGTVNRLILLKSNSSDYYRASFRSIPCKPYPVFIHSCFAVSAHHVNKKSTQAGYLVSRTVDKLNDQTLVGVTAVQKFLALVQRIGGVDKDAHLAPGRAALDQGLFFVRVGCLGTGVDGVGHVVEGDSRRVVADELGERPGLALGRDLPLGAVVGVGLVHLPERGPSGFEGLRLVAAEIAGDEVNLLHVEVLRRGAVVIVADALAGLGAETNGGRGACKGKAAEDLGEAHGVCTEEEIRVFIALSDSRSGGIQRTQYWTIRL